MGKKVTEFYPTGKRGLVKLMSMPCDILLSTLTIEDMSQHFVFNLVIQLNHLLSFQFLKVLFNFQLNPTLHKLLAKKYHLSISHAFFTIFYILYSSH